MGKYFNKTRGPISINLGNGKCVIASPKGTLYIAPAFDGAADLLAKVASGDLVRMQELVVTTQPVLTMTDEEYVQHKLMSALKIEPPAAVAVEAPVEAPAPAVEEQPKPPSGFYRKNRRNR